MLEYLYGKKFGSKIAWANTKEGDLVTLLPIGSGYFRAKPFPVQILQHPQTSSFFIPIRLWEMEQSVSKRRHIKFRCRGITRKKAHKIT